eukprot:CAMPEP_0201565050 /NCGR_PEP_ID=MMETSP0190_2-20130828/3879_1 /ASSEMBLY_ACC=CAM_ASM_000263 /TAXON_ID=37353 /ORGANISM="Rosalina sp." /LENGTH=149 /DNA_ID=CAMNT_0047982053 /DNA_START=31 /DNA_END=477 /DNA_ORIENTATION=+
MAAPKKKKGKNKGAKIELNYECLASGEMMIKIFTMKEDAFLKACFYGQIKKSTDSDDNTWIIGDDKSFTFKIISESPLKPIDDDPNEYELKLKWIKKEWKDDQWTDIKLTFTDDEDIDKKCYLKFKQTGIPNEDKHGNPEQARLMEGFW